MSPSCSTLLDQWSCPYIRPGVLSHLLSRFHPTSSQLFLLRSTQLSPSTSVPPFSPHHISPAVSPPHPFPASAGPSLFLSVQWFSVLGTFSGSGKNLLGFPSAASLALLEGLPTLLRLPSPHGKQGHGMRCLILGSYLLFYGNRKGREEDTLKTGRRWRKTRHSHPPIDRRDHYIIANPSQRQVESWPYTTSRGAGGAPGIPQLPQLQIGETPPQSSPSPEIRATSGIIFPTLI